MKALILERIKVIGIGVMIAATLALFASSCTTSRDCQGVRHQRLDNGINL